MKSHRECAGICGGGTDPPLLQAGIQKKKNMAVWSIPVAQSHARQAAFLPPHTRWWTGLEERVGMCR